MTYPFSNQQIFDSVNSCELSDADYDILYPYYVNNNLMPYGTAKARNGDPYQFIFDDLEDRFVNLAPTAKDPIHYRDYIIMVSNVGLTPKYYFVHNDNDGEGDNRYGYCETMVECVESIDERVDA